MKLRVIFFAIIFLLISALSILTYFQQKKINTLNIERKQLTRVAQDSGRVAHAYINLFGQKVSENKALELSLRNAQELSDTKELSFLNQFEDVRKSLKNLDAALRINSSVVQSLKLKTSDSTILLPDRSGDGVPDTLIGRSFSYSDQYNSISGLTVGDTTTIKAIITAPIDGAFYWKRKHKFIFKNWRYGRKEYSSELTSPNPWVHLTNHELIKVIRK